MDKNKLTEIWADKISKALSQFDIQLRSEHSDISDAELMDFLLDHISVDALKNSIYGYRFEKCCSEALEKLKQAIQECVETYLDKEYSWCKQEDGSYLYELGLDQGDCVGPQSLEEFAETDNPHMAYWEYMNDTYQNLMLDVRDRAASDIQDMLNTMDIDAPSSIRSLVEQENNIEMLVRDCLLDHFDVAPPLEEMLGREILVDIFMDTGDGNYDFTLNQPSSDGTLNPKAGIVWLAQQQGYSKETVEAALASKDAPEDPFLVSLKQEVENVGSSMSTVTFLVRMTLGKWLDLLSGIRMQDYNGRHYDATENPDCGTIVLRRDTECGLYDPWNGAGSCLEIVLQKDVEIPIRLIWKAISDDPYSHGYGKVSIQNVYGVVSSIWRDTVVSGPNLPKQK